MSNRLVIDAKQTIDGALFIGYGDSYYNNYMIIGLDEIKFNESSNEESAVLLKDYVMNNDNSSEIDEIIDGFADGTISDITVSLTTDDISFDDLVLFFSDEDDDNDEE